MRELMRHVFEEPSGGSDTPVDQAQELVELAYEAAKPERQVELARQALALDPDCVDAHILLGDQAPSRAEAIEHFQHAVQAGERVLGPEMFRDEAGHFWGLLETRPYMRARESLAHLLWGSGRKDEAIAHLQEMLRLNPNDNQGLRYILMAWLTEIGRDDALDDLLKQYEENSAMWAYSMALLEFRRHGNTVETRKRLKAARKANKHVAGFLLGEEMLPAEPPPYYGLGSEEEAVVYAQYALRAWKATPGATAWVREVFEPRRRKKKRADDEAIGPSDIGKERLRRTPQTPDVWQAGFGQLPTWLNDEGEPLQPWALVVASRVDGLVLAVNMSPREPSPPQLWDLLAQAIEKPAAGSSHRPTSIEVLDHESWHTLVSHLDDIGIRLDLEPALESLETILDELGRYLSRDDPPGLLDLPAVTPERVAGFYKAAAAYYRQAPWSRLSFETIIKIECPKFDSGPWYAVIMGQSGMTLGLALYEDLKLLRKLMSGQLSDEQSARRTVALAMTFDPDQHVYPKDRDAARRYGWEIVDSEAHPVIYRKERGRTMRPPLVWELELMEGCLQAVPRFLADRPLDDTRPYPLTVPVAGGTLDLTLSWVQTD
jgi:tetratricopeptide (TPR) repeat protein